MVVPTQRHDMLSLYLFCVTRALNSARFGGPHECHLLCLAVICCVPTRTRTHTRDPDTAPVFRCLFGSPLFCLSTGTISDPRPISLWTCEAQVVDTALVCQPLVLDKRVQILVLKIFRGTCIRL